MECTDSKPNCRWKSKTPKIRHTCLKLTLTTPSSSGSTPWFCLILVDSVLYMYSPANRACSHVYKIYQTFVGFRTVYSQAMDALHLPLYQFHQSLTTVWLFNACRLISVNSVGFLVKMSREYTYTYTYLFVFCYSILTAIFLIKSKHSWYLY